MSKEQRESVRQLKVKGYNPWVMMLFTFVVFALVIFFAVSRL